MAKRIQDAWVVARKKLATIAKKKNFAKIVGIAKDDGFTNVKVNIEDAHGDVEISYAGRKILLQFRNEGDVPSIDVFPCSGGEDFSEEASFGANIYSDHHLSKPVKVNKEGRVRVIRQMILCPNK